MNREEALDEIEDYYGELGEVLDFETYEIQEDMPFLNDTQKRVFTKYRKVVIRNDNNHEIEKIAYVLSQDDKYFCFLHRKE